MNMNKYELLYGTPYSQNTFSSTILSPYSILFYLKVTHKFLSITKYCVNKMG